MHDIKLIRDDPNAFDAALARRNHPPIAARLMALDAERREAVTAAQTIQAERNKLSREIGSRKANGEDAGDILAAVAARKDEQSAAEAKAEAKGQELDAILATIPNLPASDVPDGKDETANVVTRTWGEPTKLAFAPKDHVAIGEALGMMDFERAARMSGARFVVLSGALAHLERALGAFMLDLQTGEHGYREVNPPLMVRDHALFGTGQLPKFAEDLFVTTTGYWLIPTAEVPLTNLVRENILDDGVLPLRYTALTPSFRAEAGAAGQDTRGMIRQHQFHKVELVSICTPEQSEAEHERMTKCAETVLQRLGLPYQVLALCTGDMGFAARKTYDLEVWLPGQNRYREISSCSNCGDFQARRMNTRFRAKGDKGTRFVHTLNGSGLAVGRTLVAVLENNQQADGSVTVPEVLRPYMGGLTVLKPLS